MASEEAIKNRVINHMNKEHTKELTHYLRAWTSLPRSLTTSPVMKDLSLGSLVIQSNDGSLHTIPINPRMGSYADARKTMAQLDIEARSKLGLKDVTVSTFRPARGMDAVVFGAVGFYYLCFFTLPYVTGSPDNVVYRFWDAAFPGGIGGYEWVVRTIFWLVVGIHVTECVVLEWTRLGPYGVRRGSWVWWCWMGTCFFEGVPSFKRFDRLVGEIREKEGKAK